MTSVLFLLPLLHFNFQYFCQRKKLKIRKRNPKYDEAFQKWPHPTQILNFCPPMATTPTQPTASSSSAPLATPILRKRKVQSQQATLQVPNRLSDEANIKTREVAINNLKTNQQTQPTVENIPSAEGYNDTSPTFIGTCSPRNPSKQWKCDQHPNILSEREMTVYDAKQCEDVIKHKKTGYLLK